MTPTEWIFALVGSALLLTTFVGLLVRKRWRTWYAFTLYLPLMAGFSLAFALHQEWYVAPGFLLQANVVNALRVAMALELAARTFRAFPGALSTLRPILLVLLIATLAVVAAVPTSTYESFLGEVQPRVLYGTVWIFTAIAALILWYRLPVAALHKSVLLSYVPYLLWDLVFLKAFLKPSWEDNAVRYVNPAIYLVMTAHWAWVAWRVEVPEPTHPPPASTRDKDRHLYSRLSEI